MGKKAAAEMNEKKDVNIQIQGSPVKDEEKIFADGPENFFDHLIPMNNLLTLLSTCPERGLNTQRVGKNQVKYGMNVLRSNKKRFGQLIKLLKTIFLGLNLLLWVCAALSLGSYGSQYLYTDHIAQDNLYLGIALIFVCFLSGFFSFYQEFKSNKIMNSFRKLIPHQTNVLRNGIIEEISVEDVVVGDIVHIKYGDLIPADVRIIESQNFKVDNSCLTGESEPQNRGPNLGQSDSEPFITANNLAFFSTSAIEGTAKCVVLRVGSETLMGKVASLASQLDSRKTPISIELDNFIMIMTIRSVFFGGLFLTVAILMHYPIIDAIFFIIGIVVANVPEGLAVSFTLILGVGIDTLYILLGCLIISLSILLIVSKKMANKNCLVKNLQSVETLGSTSVICSDKTGTITQNKMSAAHLYFNGKLIEVDTAEDKETRSICDFTDAGFLELYRTAVLCSKAKFRYGQDYLPILKRQIDGDATEKAILRCMEVQKPNVEEFRSQFIKKLDIPFNSRDKFSSCIYEDDEGFFIVMKGAPEKVVSLCKTILINDEEKIIVNEIKDDLDRIYVQLCGLGERVLGFSDARLSTQKYPPGYNFSEEDVQFLFKDLRFLGLMSLIDPPRAAVPDAVNKCRRAGIKVVMVTGDHPLTAKAIARSVGIISKDSLTIEEMAEMNNTTIDSIDPAQIKSVVVTGPELMQLTDSELQIVIQNHEEIVFARTSPEQKYKIVEAFQSLGHIVAATGDGVNDCPALKRAHIGIAMGITGTEVAKDSADMILMDDDFSSIIVGVEEGRRIFDNLKKLLCYSLADNIAEMYSVMIFIILRIPLPMGTIAMLLSVLVTDTLPAVSIAFEGAEKDILKLKPRDPLKNKLVTKQLLSYTYGQTAIFEVAAGFLSYFLTLGYYGFLPQSLIGIRPKWESSSINDLEDSYGQEWTYNARQTLGLTAQTSFFIAIVSMQVGNIIICKTRRLSIFQKGMRNWVMNLAIPIEICIAAFLIYTPGLNTGLNLLPIKFESWLFPLPFVILLIICDELRRLVIRSTKIDSFFYQEFYA